MTLYPAYPPMLAAAEFALVRFHLDLLSPCTLELGDLLGLRRILLQCAGGLPPDSRLTLFDPPLSSDPTAVRRFQKPAPPLVLRPDPKMAGVWHEGDHLDLEVLFLGTGTLAIGDFLDVLQVFGERGLRGGEGPFAVVSARTLGADGDWRRFWRAAQGQVNLAPELVRIDQWLERVWPAELPAVLEFTMPTRLLSGSRLLRRPNFRQLFPFLLRRVSSMLHAHCGLEPVDDPAELLEMAAGIEADWLESRWIDWREIDANEASESVGGFTGRLQLDGSPLEDLLWLLLLASLFGVGKGAAYGAGHCRLTGEG